MRCRYYLTFKFSKMNNLFNSVKMMRPKSNRFDLTHDVKLSLDMGQLVPICCLEAVPGDKFNIGGDALFRMAPMLAPMMHRVDVTMHYWFVPNRILWNHWESFITGNYPSELGTPSMPFVTINTANYTRLADYLGIPLPLGLSGEDTSVNAMPFAAYQKIYNDFYRDQNLQDDLIPPQTFPLVNGDNTSTFGSLLGQLRNRCWEHDYFTAALPFAQKGNAVGIPLGKIPVLADENVFGSGDTTWPVTDGSGSATMLVPNGIPGTPGTSGLFADGTNATAGTINDLRRAYALQSWFEKNARGGTRYAEHIKAHWGITVPDYRLQRPEYIVGVKSPIVISEVLNTTGTTDAPQGNMSGHGLSVANGRFSSYKCSEHGFVIGILSVMPKTCYQQGLDKFWLKTQDPTQYFYPSFAHLGEQEVFNEEVYAFDPDTTGGTFGYVPRYAEYKFANSRVAGDFRSTLNFWHMGRIFDAAPALNGDFVESDPTTRIFAVETEVQHVWAHVVNKISAIRMMPRFGTPSTI